MSSTENKIRSFTDLRTWQNARELTVTIYRYTEDFPQSEKYGLVSQMRRSATSVAANIAEGFSRNGQRDKIHFYSIALGSLTETLSHSYISVELGFIKPQELGIIEEQTESLQKMIHGLIKTAAERKLA